MEKSWKFQGGGGEVGSTMKPLGTENPGGWGVKLEKNPPWGVWIFSGTTHYVSLCDFQKNAKFIQ